MTSIEAILEHQVGNRSVEQVIRDFRNKQLVHTLFSATAFERHLRPGVRLDNPSETEAIRDEVAMLFFSTYNLYDNILNRFPELRSTVNTL